MILRNISRKAGIESLVYVYGAALSLVFYLISHDSQLVCTVPVFQLTDHILS